jgi:hypothetical protein
MFSRSRCLSGSPEVLEKVGFGLVVSVATQRSKVSLKYRTIKEPSVPFDEYISVGYSFCPGSSRFQDVWTSAGIARSVDRLERQPLDTTNYIQYSTTGVLG